MRFAIRALTRDDWSRIAEIYRQGIETGEATFEDRVPSWAEWDRTRHSRCRIVAENDRGVVGFAALTPASTRRVYAGVAEVMVYVAGEARSQGVGRALLHALVARSEADGIWTLQAGIFPENRASLAVHRATGFRVVGTRQAIGRFHDGRWRDVLLLERRSRVVGID